MTMVCHISHDTDYVVRFFSNNADMALYLKGGHEAMPDYDRYDCHDVTISFALLEEVTEAYEVLRIAERNIAIGDLQILRNDIQQALTCLEVFLKEYAHKWGVEYAA